MPKRITPGSQRITLPKRNISTSPDGSLATGMGMNPPSIGNTPGILPGLAALSAARTMQSKAIPQRYTNQFGFTQYGNPFEQYEMQKKTPYPLYSPLTQPKDTSAMFTNSPDSRVDAAGKAYRDYSLNVNARLQAVIMEGADPQVLTLADAVRLRPGFSVEDVKSMFSEMGYEYVPTSQGGVLRNTGGAGGDGTTPIGNSPGAGYTWSGGAWHAPRGQDPNSDIKSVYYSRSRRYVTPEVARLLNKKKRMRSEQNSQNVNRQAATPSEGQNTSAEGLVNLRASFG